MHQIFNATEEDLEQIKELLLETNLVIEDVYKHIENFIIIRKHNGSILACAGMEIYNEIGFLRSVAVKSNLQGKGIGSLLVESVINKAKEKNIQTLFLLTETAEAFFSKFSFKTINRDKAPESIKNTYEFEVACAETGILMRKEL